MPAYPQAPQPTPAPALQQPEEEYFGQYTPGAGFQVAKTELGELNIQVFSYVRNLNQSGLDPTFTNAFGRTNSVEQREDLQLNKVLPWKNTVVRMNAEYLELNRFPVGALSLPFPVGGNGSVFQTSWCIFSERAGKGFHSTCLWIRGGT